MERVRLLLNVERESGVGPGLSSVVSGADTRVLMSRAQWKIADVGIIEERGEDRLVRGVWKEC